MTTSTETSYLGALEPGNGVLVGGEWRAGSVGVFDVENPATREIVAEVADGGTKDATAAVDAAVAALPEWSAQAPRARSDLLVKVRELMLRDVEELAALMALENGKSLADARGEVSYAAEFFRWYAEEAVRPNGDFGSSPAGGTRTIVTHKPVGVAALVTPWNFPAAMATRKIAPALAAGCTVVLKPASETPLTVLAIARLIAEAGVPDGVVNVVPGEDAAAIVSTWLTDPRVRKISFTGSTGVGRILLRQAADRIVNTSMELGGNAPFVVTASADIEAAIEGAMVAKFRNGGQACTAANRFYVHADVAEEFTSRLGAAVEALRVGPADEGSDIGPLISAKAYAGVSKVVDEAVAAGAEIAHRADVPESEGYFYPPTVVTGVPADSPLVREEIFGPVAPIVVWDDAEELLATVNDTEYGLAAYVYGEMGEALHLAERIDAGMVGVNRGLVSDPAAPFGGVKQSGIGREGARAGLEEYLETQYLSVAW
ncbi:succinate-semialdehyde dehydrogenase/glutarate-semialdehyde dehydrogenase [Nocardioides luteus]|uniref:NAD-dependent succinate-semialdehyde dehydrogenase n=1 Tax=Nocardioides luteus TaxID=1844 RepID=A0ABQ5SRI0_9ACTN|nr:NAD-dependent succinate-semialdehyde dehydrogenase [Nocardioides luteus]MDR7311216.1 succinate-semialdehyde dehydrogenase/glutarate-semialdehyde dehydrogenase [Nocardioides luteus]GGR63090.1 NAD-dependent succinate-semialdehyde dehydrogenase [Nocardioides luteus]GLJ66763.1 NAD-dependent succinate-semialdehyde dehydrogenase [Nocardioides luteus]